MGTQPNVMVTQETYLERERTAEFKSEYYRGEIFAMSGASKHHVRIASQLLFALMKTFEGSNCFVFTSDLRIHIPKNGLYTYPDIGMVCGEDEYLDNHSDTLLNPDLLVEILSPSTESYDRGQKFAFYRQIESLQEYVLVAQDRRSIDVFVRGKNDGWWLREPDYEDGTVVLLGHSLQLDEIYRGIPLEDKPGIRRPPQYN